MSARALSIPVIQVRPLEDAQAPAQLLFFHSSSCLLPSFSIVGPFWCIRVYSNEEGVIIQTD